jgi:hypothetical protein
MDDYNAERLGLERRFLPPPRVQCDSRVSSHGFEAALAVLGVSDVITERPFDRCFVSANDDDSRLDFPIGRECRTHEGIITVACFNVHSNLQLDLAHVLFPSKLQH